MIKRIFALFILFVFLVSLVAPYSYSASMMPEFLYENGVKLYKQGKYDDAMHAFLEALLIDPNYKPALKYIELIKKRGQAQEEIIPVLEPAPVYEEAAPAESYDASSFEQEMIAQKHPVEKSARSISPLRVPEEVKPATRQEVKSKSVTKAPEAPIVIKLDALFSKIPQPIELNQGRSVIIEGSNIQRFLVVEPNILLVDKKNQDQLLAMANDIGYTYVHIWDANDRWTLEFLCKLREPEGPTYDELLRKEAEETRNFKLTYNLAWSSIETGKRLKKLNRTSYSWSHGLNLDGETPYGKINSGFVIRSLGTSTDLTFLHFGLSDGSIGPFKGFKFDGGDFTPAFSNLAFSGQSVRGAMISSPAFHEKIKYDAFWGREGGGRYGNLSPGLTKIKHSFLNGFNLAFLPTKEQVYKASVMHGWGRDRDAGLPKTTYDTTGKINFERWGMEYDAAYDTDRFAYTTKLRYTQPNLNLSSEFRNIDRNFSTLTGQASRTGEIGNLFTLDYKPNENLTNTIVLDVYRDRQFPAEDNPNRLNESLNWNTLYLLDPTSSLGLNYNLQNRIGSISQSRYQSGNLNYSKRFHLLREISFHAAGYYQKNEAYSAPASSYVNEKATAGLRFKLLGELYYYVTREMNWLKETESKSSSKPNYTETGLDWAGPFWTSPFSGIFRLAWHDEEKATSPLSFLAGEDYLEGYSELTYRPDSNMEIYGSCRARNTWADKQGVAPRIDLNFNAGLRYVWDTGVSWETTGNIEGYVFKDINSDGLRQRDDAPVEGVKVYLGKDKFQITDIFGYYKFKNVKGKKAFITLDATTLPQGFVVTVPISQEIAISQGRNTQVNFGIISRSEISGLVFEDVNEDGKYSVGDKGVQGAVLTLEDGSQATSDATGKYVFAHASTGAHTIILDLNSLPVYYLPQTSLKKEITLYEGVSYVYNIPLKKIKD